VAEPGDPVMIVVGGGAIALSTAEEFCARQGHRVVVLWRRDPDLARAVESIGAVFITAARPDSAEGLDRAGVHHAVTILALSPDDHLNLHAALLARDLNPRIRIVLRQFNRTLAHKMSRTCRTARFCRSPGTRLRRTLRPRSIRPASAGCSSRSPTGRSPDLLPGSQKIAGSTAIPSRMPSGCWGRGSLRSTAPSTSPMTRCSREEPSWSCMVKLPRCRVPRLFDRWLG